MNRPRILIIDDQLGGPRADGRNSLREDFCYTVGLQDITGDVRVTQRAGAVGDAVFCRGQVIEDGRVRNDLDGTLQAIREGWKQWPRWALLLLDWQFKTGLVDDQGEPKEIPQSESSSEHFGLTLLRHIAQDSELRDIPVVILSAMPRDEIERLFADYKQVCDFVDKNDVSRERVAQIIQDHGLIEGEGLIGRSVSFLKCLCEARQRANLGNENILLLGESGTGKELIPRYIHNQSPRRSQPYITVYTQGVPEALVDDRLFGHEPGAFTGAKGSVQGAAELAHKGTLFIDEFGDLSPVIQDKLLRLLDKNVRQSQRIGAPSDQTRTLDLTVIMATNKLDIFETDDLRRDLLFRVASRELMIRLPSLSERREDIPLLAEHFVRKSEQALRATLAPAERAISPEAMRALCEADWPGNVRELERVIESAVYRYPNLRILSAGHLRLTEAAPEKTPRRHTVIHPSSETLQATSSPTLADLLSLMGTVEFPLEPEKRSQWAGKLPDLRAAYMNLLGRLVHASLLAKRNPTAAQPEGEINFTGAMSYLVEKPLNTAAARDLLKRLFRLSAADRQLLDGVQIDPLLETCLNDAKKKR